MQKFDSNKAIGVFCAAGLVFLFAKWGAAGLFDSHEAGHGEEHAQAYIIDTGVSAGGAEVEEVNPAVFLAVADADKGEKLFAKCKACHALDKHGTGPELGDVYDRGAGVVDGFDFSSAMAESGLTWDADSLFHFLGDVKGTVPGTKMSFAGIKPEQDRADIIAYLAADKFDRAAFEAAAAAPAEGATEEGAEAAVEGEAPAEAEAVTEEGAEAATEVEAEEAAVEAEAAVEETAETVEMAVEEIVEEAPAEAEAVVEEVATEVEATTEEAEAAVEEATESVETAVEEVVEEAPAH